ncbi:MAG TPA: SRPBCC domain-containing protein [Flavipsychrobacter sp.]|nr:SRPBCC domain-containing protein [Flavipsychrobacter sp.]
MEKIRFAVTINAPREKVWSILWTGETYRAWTSVFSEGSRAITDWKKGSKVLFTDGSGSGMVSRIDDLIPNEFMSFQHLGELKDGVEDTTSERVQQWAGGRENYTLNAVGDNTELIVELDLLDEFKDYFMSTFPKALAKVKELSEQ